MGYGGDVVVGGPSDLRVLDELEVRKAAVGPSANNTYLLTCRAGGAQLLVDAAADADRLVALVREGSPDARLDLIVTTHRHLDHVGALESLVAVTGAPVAAGAPDAEAVSEATGVAITRPLHDGDTIVLGHVTLEVIGLRGHTPGSVALAYREPEHASGPGSLPGRVHLFTGDTLFPGGVGSTSNDPARFAQLYADVTTKLFDRYDDATWVYPGHGLDTTLGAERPHLDEWRERGW
ncbi:MBL fold metallo-hydrolase [Oerskovia sp. Sa1BUA8]|uniref:MBL fold metallo-hydrolase n=1 Tax=Oerskovia douganii TaxID=2762210 RepID=A0A9D5YYB4_9CELL|nr:MBL fold metallo-hydrolase [Oerskovia douganii]MBE7700448.1 MBL fold metallo-hydrolase [Oerskovia douganii]